MPELGGPTTQSGIRYQNSIAALYLGRLCEGNTSPPNKHITEVRCEALTSVDDIVLTYADGHQEFIQAKEILEPSGDPWHQLWRDFAHQYKADEFKPLCDRLILYVGEKRNEWRLLKEMSGRTEGNNCVQQWYSRLTKEQNRLFERIKPILTEEKLSEEDQQSLFSCIVIQQDDVEDLQLHAFRSLPPCNVHPVTLFRLLRDRAGEYASQRKPVNREALLASLHSEHHIFFDSASVSYQENMNPLSFVPENRSRLQWFISSRLKDDCMRPERDAAIEAITTTHLVLPWAWEYDVLAGNHPYEETCLHVAARSDGLILLIDGDVSPLCEKEYRAAANSKKTCYIFIKAEGVLDATAKRFVEAERKLGSNPIRFRNLDELKSAIIKSLQSECIRKFRHFDHILLSTPPTQARL